MSDRTFISILAMVAVLTVGGFVFGQPSGQHGLVRTAEDLTALSGRSCIFPDGGWTIVNCSNVAAASSAALNAWSRYVIQCTDDSYIATGTATGQAADANDGYLPNGSWLEIMTTDSIKYYSCLNKTSDADCRHIECR